MISFSTSQKRLPKTFVEMDFFDLTLTPYSKYLGNKCCRCQLILAGYFTIPWTSDGKKKAANVK